MATDLGDAWVGTFDVLAGQVEPAAAVRVDGGTVVAQGAPPLPAAPAALELSLGLQAHAAAVPLRCTLVQVHCGEKESRDGIQILYYITAVNYGRTSVSGHPLTSDVFWVINNEVSVPHDREIHRQLADFHPLVQILEQKTREERTERGRTVLVSRARPVSNHQAFPMQQHSTPGQGYLPVTSSRLPGVDKMKDHQRRDPAGLPRFCSGTNLDASVNLPSCSGTARWSC